MRVRLMLAALIALGLTGLYLVHTGGGSQFQARYVHARSCDGLLPAGHTIEPPRHAASLTILAESSCESSATPSMRTRLVLTVYTPLFWKSRRDANLFGRPPANAVVVQDLGAARARAWVLVRHGRADGYLQVDNVAVQLSAPSPQQATRALRRLAGELAQDAA
jgi:hypothetical protein